MPELFNTEEVDLSSIYRDSAAPKDPDPSELLYGQIGQALKGAPSPVRPTVTKSAAGVISPSRPPSGAPIDRKAIPPTHGGAQGSRPAGGASQDSMDVLGRLKPMGITNLNSLRGKSDIELRKLSSDVVQYELRQQSLSRFFKQNPDGSWDFTTGPDGQPTGLDAAGKVIPPGGAVKPPAAGTKPPAPAPKPAPRPTPTGTVKPPPRPSGSVAPAPTRVTRPPV